MDSDLEFLRPRWPPVAGRDFREERDLLVEDHTAISARSYVSKSFTEAWGKISGGPENRPIQGPMNLL